MNEHQVLLHLSLIDGIGPSTIKTILQYKPAHYTWADLYALKTSDFSAWGLSPQIAEKLTAGLRDTKKLDTELALIDRYAVNWCSVLDNEYPELLKNIHVPPAILYWYGAQLNTHEMRLAVVGSRNANQYGQQLINSLVGPLASQGITIVSGGALGIDALAHQAALDVSGKTIVVLGSGLLHASPISNKKLFDRVIAQQGIMMSALPLQTQASEFTFPARNRIIAGLSRGTLVIQAAKKSGARITAQYALEQGRDVFAVPGSIHDELSVGCHRLIQEGAKLVTHAHDILQEYGMIASENEMAKQQTIAMPMHQFKPDSPQAVIINACIQPASIDDLTAYTKLSLAQLQDLLFNLQLEGFIQQDFTGMWRIV